MQRYDISLRNSCATHVFVTCGLQQMMAYFFNIVVCPELVFDENIKSNGALLWSSLKSVFLSDRITDLHFSHSLSQWFELCKKIDDRMREWKNLSHKLFFYWSIAQMHLLRNKTIKSIVGKVAFFSFCISKSFDAQTQALFLRIIIFCEERITIFYFNYFFD